MSYAVNPDGSDKFICDHCGNTTRPMYVKRSDAAIKLCSQICFDEHRENQKGSDRLYRWYFCFPVTKETFAQHMEADKANTLALQDKQ